jgi:DNA-binding transcriptional LysR family regulator
MIDRRLRVLQAIARHGTVTAAAEVCRLTPSAVSHQMQALARELDLTLLEHVGRNVRLTPAARALLVHAEGLTERWEHAQAELAVHRTGGAAGEATGTLRFCAFSTAASVVVPKALSLLGEAHPELRVVLLESEPARAFDLIAAGESEIGVVVATPSIPPASDGAFDQQALYDEPLDLLVGPGHPLAGLEGVALRDVADDPWIVGTPGRAYHQLVLLACTSAGFAPRVAHHVDTWDAGAALVSRGFGVALVPRLVDLPGSDRSQRIPITSPPVPSRHVLTAVRAGSQAQPGIAAGLAALRRVSASLPTSISGGSS